MHRKDPWLAAVLGFFFGPLGLFYVSIGWAIATGSILTVIALATGGTGCVAWVGCAFLGYMLAQEHNAKIDFRENVSVVPPPARIPPRRALPEPSVPPPLPAKASRPPAPRVSIRSRPTPRPLPTSGAAALRTQPPPEDVVPLAPGGAIVPGVQIDRYIVEEQLGAGGMARVYKVRHAVLQSTHAMKILSPELVVHDDVRQRFLAEGRIQAQLRHRNIVPVTDTVAVPGVAGLVMDFIEGSSLDELMRGFTSPPPLDWVRDVFVQVLEGVGFAHSRGIVHRDLKPANVLVEDSEPLHVRVMDFGIAKIAGDGGPSKTRTGHQMGTPHYMSPEQIRLGAGTVTAQSDIFSLGVTLYELVTGQMPFDGTTDFDVQLKITQGAFVEPRDVRADVPFSWSKVIDRALATQPEERFATCEDFADALANA